MDEWKELNIPGIAAIERCVAEFDVWELYISPYAKFKVKVFENAQNKFSGYTNLQVIDETGSFYGAVGYGSTIKEALEDTIRYFFKLTASKPPEEWTESDFMCSDSYDF